VNTKRLIVDFLADRLPEHRFMGERKPNLVFQYAQQNAIYRCIAIQRDSASHGLSVQLAATYNPRWRGEPAYPIGFDTGLANLKHRNHVIEAIKHWESYEPTLTGLQRTLAEIHRQFQDLVPAFFKESENQLLSNSLLQIALTESKRIPAEERSELQTALESVKFRLDRLEHPIFLRLRDRLRAAWTPDIPKEQRQATNRIAYDCLALTSERVTIR
jgi:hypothetical protein